MLEVISIVVFSILAIACFVLFAINTRDFLKTGNLVSAFFALADLILYALMIIILIIFGV